MSARGGTKYLRRTISGLQAELARESDHAQIIAGHLLDERRAHLATRKMLAREWGVPVDSEAYDEAWDRHATAGEP